MCGICGILRLDGAPADRDLLARMNSRLIHRGPDDEGLLVAGSAGLAMRRLSIIDVEGARQPIPNEDESIWIVFNGEVYNYPELRTYLLSRGHQLRTHGDTEVIVHLYEELGLDCVNRLNGMFAFAIWDSGKQQLFLARDRIGIKPLFYSVKPGDALYFASEMKALFEAPIDLEMDRQAVYDYLSLMYVPTPATAFKNIRQLEPGHFLSRTPGDGIRIKEYWDLNMPSVGDEGSASSHYEEEVLDLIETAIRRQMISDVPIGALLSGGLDSTTVTAVMAEKLSTPVSTFTIGFANPSYDESAEARLVAETFKTSHHEQVVHPNMIKSMTDLLNSFDQPFADYSAIPTFLVSKLASQHVKVVLTGDGGDEVFAGYPTHLAYKYTALYRMVPKIIRDRLIAPLVMSLPTSLERLSFDYKAKKFVKGADLSLEAGHYWWKVIFDERQKGELLVPEFTAGLDDSFHVFDRYFKKCSDWRPLNRLLYVDMKTFLLDDNLVKVDRMTMANGLEARVPLLDHELVEKVAMIPPAVKCPGFETKGLLRKAVSKLLPETIRKGSKKGFTPPLPFWINNELKGFLTDLFAPDRVKRTGILNPGYCSRLLNEHFNKVRDNNRQIWTLASLICRLEATESK
jgi:asparagine synthase (glutamine-hydrolysing)